MRWLRPLLPSARIPFALLAAVVCIDVAIFHVWLANLFPCGDEFALIVESRKGIGHWFFEGFSHYFMVYPEFSVPYTNFVRPGVNLVFRIFDGFKAGDRIQLVCANYGIHGAITALLYASCVRLGITRRVAIAAAAAAFLAPAFWRTPMTISPAYCSDGLAAMLVLGSILLCSTRFYPAGLLLLLAAIFTKETALPVACAVLFYALIAKRIQIAGPTAAFLFLWWWLRHEAFRHSGGVYVFAATTGILHGLASRLAWFAFIPISFCDVHKLKQAFHDSNHIAILLSVFTVLLNIAMWILFVRILIRNRNDISQSIGKLFTRSKISGIQQYHLMAVISAFLSAVFCLAVGAEIRLTYVFYLCLIASLASAGWYSRKSDIRILLIVILVPAFLMDIESIRAQEAQQNSNLATYSASRALVAELRSIRPSALPVYVVNDFVGGYSSEDHIGAYAGFSGDLRRGSSIDLSECKYEQWQDVETNVNRISANEIRIYTSVPGCARFLFENADPDIMVRQISENMLYRNDSIRYQIPEARIGELLTKRTSESNLTIYVKNASLIYYDFAGERWVYVP